MFLGFLTGEVWLRVALLRIDVFIPLLVEVLAARLLTAERVRVLELISLRVKLLVLVNPKLDRLFLIFLSPE